MKVDKDTLVKNRFWILLSAFVPLELFAILWLYTAVEGAVDADRKKMTDHREKLKKNAEAKLNGNMEMNLCKEKYRKLELRKDTIWKEAWKNQQGLVFWPAKVEKTYEDLDFGASAGDSVRGTYAQADVYLAQYEDMAKMFQVQVPERTTKGEKPKMQTIDPVQFEGGWQKVLRPVEKWKVLPPSDEEVWLAQEDAWVRHELLGALKKANTSVARFKSVGKTKPDEGPPFTQVFENPYWRIELSLYPKAQQYYVKGKITNIGKKRLALGRAYFWLQVQPDEKEPRIVVPIEGASRAVGESWDIKETLLDLFQNPAGLFGLEQVLEPRTAPVRRIDDIALYYHSHRTYEPALLAAKQFARQGPAPIAPTPKQPIGLPSPTGTKSPLSSGLTANGLTTQRYTDVTSQVRRMPLGLVVVADQAHIPEVLTELANCKLRMQTTQVNWQHFRGTLEPEEKQTPAPKGGPKPPVGAPKEKPVAEEPQNNLVELSIYGIVSLYERPGQKAENETAKKSTPGPKRKK